MCRLLVSAALLAALAACGTRGPLTLPPPPEKPAAKLAAAPIDNSKAAAETSK